MKLLKNIGRKNRLILETQADRRRLWAENDELFEQREGMARYISEMAKKLIGAEKEAKGYQDTIQELRSKLLDAQAPFREEIEELLRVKLEYFELIRTLKLEK